MIANYEELKLAIYKWLVRDASDSFFTSDMMDNIIFLAEAELNRRLRIRQMRDTANISIAASNNTASLPSGFLQAYSVWLSSPVNEIQSASAGVFTRYNYYETSGVPSVYYVDGTDIIFGPIPDGTYTAVMEYYKKIPNLGSGQATNEVLLMFPDLYLFVCLKHAYIADQDIEREGMFEQRCAGLVQAINTNEQRVSFSKGARGIARSII